MFSSWNKLFNTDCIVIKVGMHTVYPIFRVGHTSLMASADDTYTNKQISRCKHINILIRDPGDRFVSGLRKYSRKNDLDVNETWKLVEQGKLIDRHFVPQYMWLLHLYKFYKGTVTLKPFSHLKKITNIHKGKKFKVKKGSVALLKSFVEVDYKLMEYYNKKIKLGELIKEHRHALS